MGPRRYACRLMGTPKTNAQLTAHMRISVRLWLEHQRNKQRMQREREREREMRAEEGFDAIGPLLVPVDPINQEEQEQQQQYGAIIDEKEEPIVEDLSIADLEQPMEQQQRQQQQQQQQGSMSNGVPAEELQPPHRPNKRSRDDGEEEGRRLARTASMGIARGGGNGVELPPAKLCLLHAKPTFLRALMEAAKGQAAQAVSSGGLGKGKGKGKMGFFINDDPLSLRGGYNGIPTITLAMAQAGASVGNGVLTLWVTVRIALSCRRPNCVYCTLSQSFCGPYDPSPYPVPPPEPLRKQFLRNARNAILDANEHALKFGYQWTASHLMPPPQTVQSTVSPTPRYYEVSLPAVRQLNIEAATETLDLHQKRLLQLGAKITSFARGGLRNEESTGGSVFFYGSDFDYTPELKVIQEKDPYMMPPYRSTWDGVNLSLHAADWVDVALKIEKEDPAATLLLTFLPHKPSNPFGFPGIDSQALSLATHVAQQKTQLKDLYLEERGGLVGRSDLCEHLRTNTGWGALSGVKSIQVTYCAGVNIYRGRESKGYPLLPKAACLPLAIVQPSPGQHRATNGWFITEAEAAMTAMIEAALSAAIINSKTTVVVDLDSVFLSPSRKREEKEAKGKITDISSHLIFGSDAILREGT
ncbi:unnamed protein product [Vitrella brassicaformis CCMP3155]|uniref:Uncharacterized protein n=1 Tax=Vitrella brassicaformis (strain CCMP3155) TaxID=1169540 RepID=A0A0G4FTS5_VITBC|nr:unnamed protein product [Vitrella brassicaformis CCMP3155]|eukprot:CEM18346.1 unnamed protein product [Vitrella brassicaformis CCMP3155]